MTATAIDGGLHRSSGRASSPSPVRVRQTQRSSHPDRRNTRIVAIVALIAVVMVGLPLVAALKRVDRADLRAVPGSVWLSAEARGRIVMAASGASQASVGIDVAKPGQPLDLADTPTQVLVHVRGSGQVERIDPVSGAVAGAEIDPVRPIDDRSQVVAAGPTVYVVDPVRSRVYASESLDNPPVELSVPDGFDQWVGTQDGRLWLLTSRTGAVVTVDGTNVATAVITTGAAQPQLTSTGDDAIIVERATARVRWLSRNQSGPVNLPGVGPLSVQQPLRGSGCITVTRGLDGLCIWPNGTSAPVRLLAPISDADQLFSDGELIVIVRPSTNTVLARNQAGQWSNSTRGSPSGRRLVGIGVPSAVLIDDPGSRYALTFRGTDAPVLDKLSRRTVLLESNGGVGGEGFTSAGKSEVVAENATDPNPPDTNGVNDPPQARNDDATTRSGRPVEVNVLANDLDPEGDPLTLGDEVTDVGPPGTATAEISNGRIVVVPAAGVVGQASFEYTAIDSGALESRPATLRVRIVPSSGNTNPVAAGDRAATVEGVPVDLTPLRNDTDAEGDPLVIVSVGSPTNGAATLLDGTVRYTPADGFVGTDAFSYEIGDGYGGTAIGVLSITVDKKPPVNRKPLAVDDRVEVIPGQSRQINITANDSDPDGDVIRITSIDSHPQILLTQLPDQTIDVRPRATAEPSIATIKYTIQDPSGEEATAELVVVIGREQQTNRPPTALDDAFVLTGPGTLAPLTNDADPDGDTLSISDVRIVSGGGSVQRANSISVRYSPDSATERAVLEYTVTDAAGATDTAAIRIQIEREAAPSAPIARDDVATVFPGDTVRVNVLANDSHPNGLPFSILGSPSYGAGVAAVEGSTITFTPPADAVPPTSYTITYTIRDIGGRTSSARVLVGVVAKPATNRPPVAVNDQAVVAGGGVVLVPVLSNDSDPDGPELRLVTVTPASLGSASVVGSSIRFTAPEVAGTATMRYTIEDPEGLQSSATVIVQIRVTRKDPPIARDDVASVSVGTNQLVEPLANDIDPDGSSADLELVSVGTPSGLTVTVRGERVLIEGVAAGAYSVPYTVRDADGLSATGRIAVTVAPPANVPPEANDDIADVRAGETVEIPVLANDADPDGGHLVVVGASGGEGLGVVGFSATSVTFTADLRAAGPTELTYTIEDSAGARATGRVLLTIAACAAAAPVLSNDSTTTRFQTPVLIALFANDASHRGRFTISDASDGSVSVVDASSGTVSYTPPNGFNEVATFTYSVVSDCGDRATANVRIDVNRSPRAADDSATVEANKSVTIDVRANDSDPDGDNLVVTGVSGSATTDGVNVSLTAPPTPGIVQLTYTIEDIGGLSASAVIVIEVVPPANREPTASDDSGSVISGGSTSVNVLANDDDPDGDPLSLTIDSVSPGDLGTASVNDRSIAFTANAGVTGQVAIRYVISDGRGGSAGATLTVTIEAPPNNAPIATDDQGSISAGTSGSIAILGNDSDPDGDEFSVVGVSVVEGACTVEASGSSLTVSAPLEFTGTCVFRYQIQDSRGAEASANVTVEVLPA